MIDLPTFQARAAQVMVLDKAAATKLYNDLMSGMAPVVTVPVPAPTPTTSPSAPGQPVVLSVAPPAETALPGKVRVSLDFTPMDRDYNNMIVDAELWMNGAKVEGSQAFKEGVNLPKGVKTTVVLELPAHQAGSYTITAGAFDAPAAGSYAWGTKRVWVENIVPALVKPAPVYTPTTSNPSSLFRAKQTVNDYVSQYPTLKTIADQPQGVWLGDWIEKQGGTVKASVANLMTQMASTETALFVLYNIPYRDNGNYSAGGLTSGSEYLTWIDNFVAGLGDKKAIVILEPDALGLAGGMPSDTARTERYNMMRSAIQKLKAKPNVKVYVDLSSWLSPADAVKLLTGVKPTTGPAYDGFSVNVSGYVPLAKVYAWADQVSSLGGGLRYVVDTSRNGVGAPEGVWCNPAGQGLGKKPTLSTGKANVDAFLWIKTPGESDGTCEGGPNAGNFWPDRALELVKNAVL